MSKRRQTRLGEMLRLYRTVRGQSLRDLAPQIGIGHATLMRIEAGQAFDADTLLKLWVWMIPTSARAIPRGGSGGHQSGGSDVTE